MAEDTQKREQLKQDREVLVQHVLVKEDQLQLLVEIQRRLMGQSLFPFYRRFDPEQFL